MPPNVKNMLEYATLFTVHRLDLLGYPQTNSTQTQGRRLESDSVVPAGVIVIITDCGRGVSGRVTVTR